MRRIREVLGKQVDGGWKPREWQLVIWQTPPSLLNSSIVVFAVGLSVLVWKSVSWSWAWDDIKVQICEPSTVVIYADQIYRLLPFSRLYWLMPLSFMSFRLLVFIIELPRLEVLWDEKLD